MEKALHRNTIWRQRLRESGRHEVTIIVPEAAVESIKRLAHLLCNGSRIKCKIAPGEIINF
jgi:hypothetical protein